MSGTRGQAATSPSLSVPQAPPEAGRDSGSAGPPGCGATSEKGDPGILCGFLRGSRSFQPRSPCPPGHAHHREAQHCRLYSDGSLWGSGGGEESAIPVEGPSQPVPARPSASSLGHMAWCGHEVRVAVTLLPLSPDSSLLPSWGLRSHTAARLLGHVASEEVHWDGEGTQDRQVQGGLGTRRDSPVSWAGTEGAGSVHKGQIVWPP